MYILFIKTIDACTLASHNVPGTFTLLEYGMTQVDHQILEGGTVRVFSVVRTGELGIAQIRSVRYALELRLGITAAATYMCAPEGSISIFSLDIDPGLSSDVAKHRIRSFASALTRVTEVEMTNVLHS